MVDDDGWAPCPWPVPAIPELRGAGPIGHAVIGTGERRFV